MKKILLICSFQIFAFSLFAQRAVTPDWKADPFNRDIFIENGGQLQNVPNNDKILYHADFWGTHAYFTANGIMYSYEEDNPNPLYMGMEAEEAIEKHKERERGGIVDTFKQNIDYMALSWEGANPNPIVTAEEKRNDYYTYYMEGTPSQNPRNIRVNVYRKIVFHDMYPGIDVQYSFSEGSHGMKRSLIVHPGADISVVKIKYSGAKGIKVDNNGNVIVSTGTKMGDYTDPAPIAQYEEGGNIELQATVKGNIQSFSVKGKASQYRGTLHADVTPSWSTNPAFTVGGFYDKAYNVDYDNSGNVYAFGGTNPPQVVKFNSSGVIQTTINTNIVTSGVALAIGGIAVAANGQIYVVGSTKCLTEYSTSGALLRWFKNDTAQIGAETWSIRTTITKDTIMVGEGQSQQFLLLDTNIHFSTAVIDSNHGMNRGRATGSNHPCNDVGELAIDPGGKFFYSITANDNPATFDSMQKCPIPFPRSAAVNVNNMTYTAVKKETYASPFIFAENIARSLWCSEKATGGFNIDDNYNGLTAGVNNLYVWDGLTVARVSKTTLAVSATFLPTGGGSIQNSGPETGGWGGIATVDACDDLYIGIHDSVLVMDGATFTLESIQPSIFLGAGDTVKDVEINRTPIGSGATTKYIVYAVGGNASGTGFVTATQVKPTTTCDVPLPIDLLYFYCTAMSNGFELTWATASEQNNSFFTIERSNDGINFSPITTVKGADNSVTTRYYSYEDLNPVKGINYYRLSQTDIYGNTVQDNISECDVEDSVLVYPNPASGVFAVQLPAQDVKSPSIISIVDMLGRTVYTQTVQNEQTINISDPTLASGLYLLRVITVEKTFTTKLLIKK